MLSVGKGFYRRRAQIEQAIGKLKRFKRVALRCEKASDNYAAIVDFACSTAARQATRTVGASHGLIAEMEGGGDDRRIVY